MGFVIGSGGRYFYDGEGKRVKKVTNSETTVFVYSSGKLIAEYSTQLAANPSTNYTTTDHLGTPRIITNELGEVKARRDFMPFGGELFNTGNARSPNPEYSGNADEVRQKFTGYQKDNETSLDFAEARMYENRHGRFTAVDPLLASGKSADPQTFNRYVYVSNNPVISTDPSGLCDETKGTCPKIYTGNVYSRTVNGQAFYNNERPDDSWSLFTGSDMFTRQSTGVRMVVDSTGWYEWPVAVGNDVASPLMSGFSGGFSDSLSGLWKGPANFGILTWNGVTDAAIRGGVPYFPAVAPNPFAIEPFPVYSDAEARHMVGSFVGAMFAPSAIAAPFSAGSSLSVVPEISTLRTNSSFPTQIHHFATNKNQTFTPQMTQIADEFGLSLNGSWNKAALPHLGRHPNQYHNFVLRGMRDAKDGASGSQAEFLRLFDLYVKEPVIQNPGLLRKSGR